MSTLIFDIETVGMEWDSLSETTQRALTRWIKKTASTSEEERSQIHDIQQGLGFSPLTGMVVAIGVYDVEREKGAVYYCGNGDEEEVEVGKYVLKQRSESKMLEDFWDGVQKYDVIVSFNGRVFDLPFLIHRSVAHRIPPLTSLMDYRYLRQQRGVKHVDLFDQLTFYGAMSRRPSLHLFCQAYGIASPKESGVDGDDVATLFAQKQFRTIAEYNMGDIEATAELYQLWQSYFTNQDESLEYG